ncbi:hypothetical protein Fsol_00049 [Candidatus Fokinia solitaria]|uniref:Uncharacterized protein n=1 Tax=Candidatus Fokinia solitaria TaxID=1802984 RepID=A0A2U8BRA1_9RICK|nr:hypothetical protein [Candidatus Fokinia solitaria]AWD32862.1 hypothetical protein Fsol_00049 [Candidatus Fokinia solitaria]
MKKYLALALASSLVMGNAFASQTLTALDAASPVLTNEDDQKIGEFEVGLQFFMTPSAVKLQMAAAGNKTTSAITAATSAPAFNTTGFAVDNVATSDNAGGRMWGFGANLGWNGLQSKMPGNGVLLGSIGGTIAYSWIDNSGATLTANNQGMMVASGVKLRRFILGARGNIAPLFCVGKDFKVGPYAAAVLGGAQTQVNLNGIAVGTTSLSLTEGYTQGIPGTYSGSAWNLATGVVGYASKATDFNATKLGKIFSTDFGAWKFYCAGEAGVRFQMHNAALQLGALFDNNEYKVPQFQDKKKDITLGVKGDAITASTIYWVNGTTSNTATSGTNIKEAYTINDLKFKKDGSMNLFLTASVIFDI